MRNGETAYLVWYNDGEQYEDNFQDVMGVFASYDDAVAWIEAEGFVKDDSDSKFWKRDDGFYPTEYCSIREFEVGGRGKGGDVSKVATPVVSAASSAIGS